jgi:hypothetical protein
MQWRRLYWLPVVWLPAMAFAHTPKPCVTAGKAARMVNKDVCVSAHVYDVVELPDGTQVLDVCPPQTPDEKCRFMIVSLPRDRAAVGALSHYRNKNVNVRGIVQDAHRFAWMELSRTRQFHGGRPEFRPNPRLTRGFSTSLGEPPIDDPNLYSRGDRGGYTNTHDLETLPAKK